MSTNAELLENRFAIAPAVDIYENADEVLILADVPGARPEGVTVRLEKEQLFLQARREDALGGEGFSDRRRDADYVRTFLVPRGIDSTKIVAALKNGVLEIRLPKSESLKPRKIAVQGN